MFEIIHPVYDKNTDGTGNHSFTHWENGKFVFFFLTSINHYVPSGSRIILNDICQVQKKYNEKKKC